MKPPPPVTSVNGSQEYKQTFAHWHDAPVLVTGDANGNVDVYRRLLGLPMGPPTIDEQVEALAKSLHPA